jgi:hypothetical protein
MATGLSISSTSNLSTGQRIVVANAILAFEPAAPDPSLVRMERIPQGHKQWDILTYARFSDANQLNEGVDLAQSEQLVAATVTITPDEKGILAQASKRLVRRQGDTNIVSTLGTMLGNSLRRKMAQDVVALYDGFTKSVVGASNTLDITHFRGSIAYLLTDNDAAYGPAPLPLDAVLHIEQISDILLDLTDTAPRGTTTGFTDELLQRWWSGRDRLYGINAFHSGIIDRDTASDSKGTIKHKSALAQVMAQDADATEEVDNSLRATEYGIFQEYSEAEIADPHGVEVYSDTTATV